MIHIRNQGAGGGVSDMNFPRADGGPGQTRPKEKARPKLTWVVARAENGVIGREGTLPWRQPADLAFFKRVTMGKPVIMGRTTFESIGRLLPGRPNIVVTRTPHSVSAPGALVVGNVDDAISEGVRLADETGTDEVAIIGGGQIYGATRDRVERIYLTVMHADVVGDTRLDLPDLSDGWAEAERTLHAADERNLLPMSFVVLDRN